MLVATKTDLTEEIKPKEIKEKALELNCDFAMTSAKTSEGVLDLFHRLGNKLVALK